LGTPVIESYLFVYVIGGQVQMRWAGLVCRVNLNLLKQQMCRRVAPKTSHFKQTSCRLPKKFSLPAIGLALIVIPDYELKLLF